MKKSSLFLWISIFSVLAVILLSACGTGTREFTISLKETNINEVIQSAAAVQDSPFQVQNVDMTDGLIHVSMTYNKEDGTELTGTYDLVLQAEDGQLKAQVSNVNMDGLVLDQQILGQIADLIKRDFLIASSNLGANVEFRSLQITEDEMQMVIQVAG